MLALPPTNGSSGRRILNTLLSGCTQRGATEVDREGGSLRVLAACFGVIQR
jgi:hypothetical protein